MSANIELENIHNHAVSNAASLAYLRLTDDITQSFEEHFNNGMAVADAMRHHVNSPMLGDVTDEQKLAKTPITTTIKLIACNLQCYNL